MCESTFLDSHDICLRPLSFRISVTFLRRESKVCFRHETRTNRKHTHLKLIANLKKVRVYKLVSSRAAARDRRWRPPLAPAAAGDRYRRPLPTTVALATAVPGTKLDAGRSSGSWRLEARGHALSQRRPMAGRQPAAACMATAATGLSQLAAGLHGSVCLSVCAALSVFLSV